MKTFKQYLIATLFIGLLFAILVGVHFLPNVYDPVNIMYSQAIWITIIVIPLMIVGIKMTLDLH